MADRAADDGLVDDRPRANDRLEPPSVSTRIIVIGAAGVVAFLALAIGGLHLYYAAVIGPLRFPAPERFPAPRLEASIDPRVLPPAERGPVQPSRRYPPQVDDRLADPILADAMRAIAAKGAHAYDLVEHDEFRLVHPTTVIPAGAQRKAAHRPWVPDQTWRSVRDDRLRDDLGSDHHPLATGAGAPLGTSRP